MKWREKNQLHPIENIGEIQLPVEHFKRLVHQAKYLHSKTIRFFIYLSDKMEINFCMFLYLTCVHDYTTLVFRLQ